MTDVLQREIRHSLVPMVLEESKGGERAFDIYSMLLRQRIIFSAKRWTIRSRT